MYYLFKFFAANVKDAEPKSKYYCFMKYSNGNTTFSFSNKNL
jgi:hypothetical protein